jgi:hypothetical protein
MECTSAYEVFKGMGEACQQAFENLNACLAGLDCMEWVDYKNGGAPPYPCSDEDAALQTC